MAEFGNDSKATAWSLVMRQALAVPGVKVDRENFLRGQLARCCDDAQVKLAIADRPANAGISSSVIDEIADGCVKRHTLEASSISAMTGLPGGWTAAVAVPADLAQFYWHILVLQQKLAYLYGWPDLLHNGDVDDETRYHLTLFTGVMHGVVEAKKVVTEMAKRIADEVQKRVPRMLLTKTAWYPIIKKIARWVGIEITKPLIARWIAKIVPLISAVVSGGVTAVAMRGMAKKLKKHLRELPLAKPDM